MPKDIDYTEPLLECYKCYRIVWRYGYKLAPDAEFTTTSIVTKNLLVLNVLPQYTISCDENPRTLYNYSYFCLVEHETEEKPCALYVWNKLDCWHAQDLYNAESVELLEHDNIHTCLRRI